MSFSVLVSSQIFVSIERENQLTTITTEYGQSYNLMCISWTIVCSRFFFSKKLQNHLENTIFLQLHNYHGTQPNQGVQWTEPTWQIHLITILGLVLPSSSISTICSVPSTLPRPKETIPDPTNARKRIITPLEPFMVPIVMVRHLRKRKPLLDRMSYVKTATHT